MAGCLLFCISEEAKAVRYSNFPCASYMALIVKNSSSSVKSQTLDSLETTLEKRGVPECSILLNLVRDLQMDSV